MESQYQERLMRLQACLASKGVDCLLLEDPLDLYYLTGCELSVGTLVVDEGGANLLVDGRYLTACQQAVSWPVHLFHDQLIRDLVSGKGVRRIGLDAERTTMARGSYWAGLLGSQGTLVSLSNPVGPLRAVKDSTELDLLRAAARLGSAGYDYVVEQLHFGCTEEEMAIALEIFWKQHGGQGLAFAPIIAFGPHSALPHYRAGLGRLQPGDCILIDIGVQRAHYHSDMTRMGFAGQVAPVLQTIYAIVAEAQAAALALCRPGCQAGDLDRAARQVIQQHGYGEAFTHSLGHGVGLAVHEAPRLSALLPHSEAYLVENMVVTVEPGIYLPGIGGVRLENTVIVTAEGYEDLTQRSLVPFSIAN